MNLKTMVQGFGAAILILILRVWPHLSRYHPAIYHSFLPMRSVVWGLLIDLGAVSLLAALLFAYLEKSETGLRTAVWAFVAAGLASALVTAVVAMRRAPIHYLSSSTAYIVTLLASLALRWLWPLAYRHAVRGFGVLLALAGCSMVWMIPQLLYQGLRTQRTDAVVPVAHPAVFSTIPGRAGKNRVVSVSMSSPMTKPLNIDFPASPCRPLTASRARALCSAICSRRGITPTGSYLPSFWANQWTISGAIWMETQPSI